MCRCRVNYDEATWARIGKMLLENHNAIHPMQRMVCSNLKSYTFDFLLLRFSSVMCSLLLMLV